MTAYYIGYYCLVSKFTNKLQYRIKGKDQGQLYHVATLMGPIQGLGGHSNALENPWNLTTHVWNELDTRFPKFDNNPNIYLVSPITSCEAIKSSS